MRTTVLLTSLGGLGIAGLGPLASQAADRPGELDYTYLQLNAINRDIDAFDTGEGLVEDFQDGGGFSLNGSYAFLPRYFVFGEYSDTDSDVSYSSPNTVPLPANTNIKRLDVGVGTAQPITDDLDFVARAAYSDIDYGSFDLGGSGDLFNGGVSGLRDELQADTTDGYLADVGVRSQLSPNIDGMIGVRYTDIGSINSTNLIGSLLFEFGRDWGLDVGVDAGSDIATYRLGVRFTPGRE